MTDHLEEARRLVRIIRRPNMHNDLADAIEHLADAIAERLPAPPQPPVQVDTEQPAFKVDDRVTIIAGGPHENMGRTATVGRVQENGDVWVYFGDQDEDEWVYSPSELVPAPRRVECLGPDERGRKWRDREGTLWSWLDGRWLSEYLDGGFVGGWTTVPADRGPFTEVVE